MTTQYVDLDPKTFVATIFPAAGSEQDRFISGVLRERTEVVSVKRIALSRLGAFNFIGLIYQGEEWLGDLRDRFAGQRRKLVECFGDRRGVVRGVVFRCPSLEVSREVKQLIRARLGRGHAPIHIGDTRESTIRTARAIFNDNTVQFLNRSRGHRLPGFQALWREFEGFARAFPDEGDLCVDGGAVLAHFGLRETRDIDFLHMEDVAGSSSFECHNNLDHFFPYSRARIIQDPRLHFYRGTIKCVIPQLVLEMKEKRGEPKDRRDVALLRKVLPSLS